MSGDHTRDKECGWFVVSVTCFVAGLGALVYAAITGDAWPVPFAVTMLACALVVGIGRLLG